MNTKHVFLFILFTSFVLVHGLSAQETPGDENFREITTNTEAKGVPVEVVFKKGVEHYYPLMAVWVEDTTGHYIHPLYVAESIAKGEFRHAKYQNGEWKSGKKLISAALPYWSHRQTDVPKDSVLMPTPEHPIADAYTGATPTDDFVLKTVIEPGAGEVFNILFEINQAWDWNEYWYNSKYPGNKEYQKSAQPALVYQVTIDTKNKKKKYKMKPLGHSHPYGANGKLYENISTLTTALEIAERIVIKLREKE